MKKLMIILFAIMLMSVFCSAVDVPQEPDLDTLNKIDQEHKSTRQFVSNELKKRQVEFIDEFTKRGDYYEESFYSTVNNAVLKLGMLWAGIYILVTGFLKLVNNKTELKKYQVLKDSIKNDIRDEIRQEYITMPEKEINLFKQEKQNLKEKQKPEEKENKKRNIFRFASKKKEKTILDKMRGGRS